MKPKDLKVPFSWEERRPLLKDSVLFVPEYYGSYEELEFPGWESQNIFGNDKPVRLEFCSGNGKWICEKAEVDTDSNWVAMEIRFDRCRKIWSKIQNHHLKNLFVVCGEAYIASKNYFPSGTIEEAFINFPDPWPKKRHAKHRLVSERFAKEVHRLLKSKGCMTLVTDDPVYRDIMIEVFMGHGGFEALFADPFYVTDWDSYGSSYFEELWREKGRTIHFMKFRKTL